MAVGEVVRLRAILIAVCPILILGVPGDLLSQDDSAGKTYFWFGMWPDLLAKYDIDSDRIVAKIKSEHGVSYGMTLSHNREKLFRITGQKSKVEVIDVKKMVLEKVHSFEEPEHIIRVDRIMEVPGGTHWYVRVDRIVKKPDHYIIEDPEWLSYNTAQQKVEEKLKELPEPIRRGARISPCSTKWHVFRSDITIVDPQTLKEEGKIELSRPLYSGLGPISVRGEDFYDGKNPDAYRMIYTMRDPVKKNRSLIGVVDIDIHARKVSGLREWGADPKVWHFHLSRDRKLAVGMKRGERRRQYDGEDPQMTLVTFDVEHGEKLRETRIDVRNGLGLAAIAPDGKKLYLAGRGPELVIHDDQHRYLKTVELEGELNRPLIVVNP